MKSRQSTPLWCCWLLASPQRRLADHFSPSLLCLHCEGVSAGSCAFEEFRLIARSATLSREKEGFNAAKGLNSAQEPGCVRELSLPVIVLQTACCWACTLLLTSCFVPTFELFLLSARAFFTTGGSLLFLLFFRASTKTWLTCSSVGWAAVCSFFRANVYGKQAFAACEPAAGLCGPLLPSPHLPPLLTCRKRIIVVGSDNLPSLFFLPPVARKSRRAREWRLRNNYPHLYFRLSFRIIAPVGTIRGTEELQPCAPSSSSSFSSYLDVASPGYQSCHLDFATRRDYKQRSGVNLTLTLIKKNFIFPSLTKLVWVALLRW